MLLLKGNIWFYFIHLDKLCFYVVQIIMQNTLCCYAVHFFLVD